MHVYLISMYELTYSMDQEDEVSKIFIIALLCVWRVRKWFLFMRTRKGFKFLMHLESKASPFETVFKSLATLLHNLEYKKVLNFLLL